MSWLWIVVLVFLLTMVSSGYHRGAVRTLFSLGVIVGSLVIAMLAGPALKRVTCEKTGIDEKMTGVIEQKMLDNLENEGQTEEKINNTKMPLVLKKILLSNLKETNDAIELGVQKGAEKIASMILIMAITLLTFLIAWCVLGFLMHQLSHVMKLPGLRQIDRLAGALINLVSALLILDLAFLILDCVSMTSAGQYLFGLIEKSKMLSSLYDKNLISMIFNSLVIDWI